ncbi:UvrD-helicase domain-containing protein [Burkholderia sp. MSMB1498]|uniref:UvrD-helicase domain-containing protein n=1 Tax=Burkholderia sp. MSMB1498 TaxID=1637842 RepID=UPI00075AB2AD|nr:UvrD-helicase domain-containing protein [Burkholderia sp. MSMB1498]KVK77173.1 hypothetical protein WS91_01890 [Burkholderia sp. MSMB1498]
MQLSHPYQIAGVRSELIPSETVVSAEIDSGPFWLRWLGLARLDLIVQCPGRQLFPSVYIASRSAVLALRKSIVEAIEAALTDERIRIDDVMAEFEHERNALFAASRYVRYSGVEQLVALHADLGSQAFRDRFNAWITHPFLASGPINEALKRRFEVVKQFFAKPHLLRVDHNEQFVLREAKAQAAYFSGIEATALTEEQVDASLRFDDANVTVAAAGSGKTSVMVSKVGYALKAGHFADDEILVLAYNKAAAKEIRERIEENVGRELNRPISVEARTFHSLGLKLWMRQQRERGKSGRPRVIDFANPAGKRLLRSTLLDLVQDNASSGFADALLNWASAYRFPVPELEPFDEASLAEREFRYEAMCKRIARNARRNARPFEATVPTFAPNIFVRSSEEARIVNWLHLRGIDFQYEQAAPPWITEEINRGLPEREQVRFYRPDFSYANPVDPRKRILHEHFGLDAEGRAPAFLGAPYEARARHKREVLQGVVRRERGTVSRFFETRSAQFANGSLFANLERELAARGIQVPAVDENRRVRALRELAQDDSITELISEFVSKYRDSGLTYEDIQARATRLDVANQARAISFLRWMRQLLRALDLRMEAAEREGGRPIIDYAGMISEAVAALRTATMPLTSYKLILVDEFQDISRLRAQFVQGLLDQHAKDSVLFCVGDDWQSINRFAGSDVGIFRCTYDGLAKALANSSASPIRPRWTAPSMLNKTFRCAQGIADVARWFVMRGSSGALIDKPVRAHDPSKQSVVRVVEHADSAIARVDALEQELERIAKVNAARGKTATVFILTRNRQEKYLPEGLTQAVLDDLAARFEPRGLLLSHYSLHGSKGLGADFVLMVGLDVGRGGYPRDGVPEPLIELLLPTQKSPHEEERRLFYVGLTRAKREVTLLCVGTRPSMFVHELEQYPVPGVVHFERLTGVVRHLCPHCNSGWLRRRRNRLTEVACSRAPFCGFVGKENRFPGLPLPVEAAAIV